MDTILGIPPGESYSGIHALADLSVCVNLYKHITCCAFSLPTSKAYVEFIGREKARAYLQCIYFKVKQQIQRELSHTIKSRCACVWIYGGYKWWLT